MRTRLKVLLVLGLLVLVSVGVFAQTSSTVKPPAGFVGTWALNITDADIEEWGFIAYTILEIGEDGTVLQNVLIFAANAVGRSALARQGQTDESTRQAASGVVDKIISDSEIAISLKNLPDGSVYKGSCKLEGQSLNFGGFMFTKGRPQKPE
jgi:hypothetical protein